MGCYLCLQTIFEFVHYEEGYYCCPLCTCYKQGVTTPKEALAELPYSMNITKKKAKQIEASYLRTETDLEYPNGFIMPRSL